MKISEVIHTLETEQQVYGDLEVCSWDSYWDKIRRCNHIEIVTRNTQEFPERAAWEEERVVVMDFDGGTIGERRRAD